MILVLTAFAVVMLFAASWTWAEEREEKVPIKDLPKKVVAAVKALVPEGTMLSAEKEAVKGKPGIVVEYDVTVRTKEGKVVEVEVFLDKDGNVKKSRIEEEDDDEGDDDDDDDEDDD
jgi:hypothetical protein